MVTNSDKIDLNGTWFVKQLGSSMKKPDLSAMTGVNITTHQNRLSHPFFHELNLSSRYHIGALREELKSGPIFSNALLATSLMCSTVWLCKHHLKARNHAKYRANIDIERASHRDDQAKASSCCGIRSSC